MGLHLTPGYYSVQVHAHLLDRDGRVWHLGHSSANKVSVVVDSEENFKLQQKQRDSAAQSSSQTGGGGGVREDINKMFYSFALLFSRS